MHEPKFPLTAPPNDLGRDDLLLHSGAAGVRVDPAQAGWRYLSFAARHLAPHEILELDSSQENAIVVVSGGDIRIDADKGKSFFLGGRPSPFEGQPSAAYLPAGNGGRIVGADSLVAVASAPTNGVSAGDPIVITPAEVAVEIRGAGNATRQINHIIKPDFPAHRLEIVEVLTPAGNWSSWPPHKHDVDAMPDEAVLEEVYFYQFRRSRAWGMQRLYRPDRSRDFAWQVGTGDVILVTDGYHPFVAAHGDDAYYLNALAGDRRTMACSYDPDYEHVRAAWSGMVADPRVPFRS